MSKTKEYIDNMMDQGVDVLAIVNTDDVEYEQFMLQEKIRESLEQMHEIFESKLETNSKSE